VQSVYLHQLEKQRRDLLINSNTRLRNTLSVSAANKLLNRFGAQRLDDLKEELTAYAKSLGVDLFGVADLSTAKDLMLSQGGRHVAGYPRAVSLGIRLLDDVVDQLRNHEDLIAISSYRGLYTAVNTALDRAALLVAKKIQDAGFRAYLVPASSMLNNGKLEATFSHKVAANLAGLGWVGKSCLIITPELGPRVRLATVLTDAPLEVGSPLPNRCGRCTKCVDICPAKAFTGRPFSYSEPRDARFKAALCDEYTEKRINAYGDVNCGLCVYVCPHGNKRKKRK
jgi:epoxyqueuosine reductase